MELSTLTALKFAADTTELERASKVIAGLVTDVSKLDKASRDAAKTEEILAKAAKLNADAHLQNAKAQDVRLKSTIAADKADKDNEQSTTKKTKAVEAHTQATKDNVSILQRQQDIYEYQTQGFSKGQAGILANAKATGQWSKELEAVLELQRQFSSNTFDKSETGLKRMVKASKEASAAQGFLNEGYSLTSKQARELSNDLDRQSASLKQQGKSYQEITKAQEAYKQNFVNEAVALNKSSDALAVVEKQRRDAVSATNYLTQADEKMNAALNVSNKAFDKAGTDSIVKYETALRQSGVSQDVATQRLAKYRVQLEQVQKQEQARREQHLTRALAPQATDVVVSLWSGQNPLTVLLQQGGQVTDLFMQSGVAAERFGEVVKKSMTSMLPSLKTVAKGVGGLIVDGFVSAGKAVNDFLARSVGVSGALDAAWNKASENGPSQYAAKIAKLSTSLTLFTSVGLAGMLAVLVAMTIEYKNIIQSESELSKALATSGGALGFSKDQAVAYAEGMKSVGVGTLKAMDAITEFAKVGKVGKEGLDGLIKSAINLEKYAGVPIEETAKKFAKLQDEPTKALIEFTEANGQVSKSVLDVVASLEQQGDKSKAVEAATRAMEAANNSMAEEAKANLSPIETLWNDIKSAIGRVKQEIYDLTTSNNVIGAMRTVWETISVVVAEVWFTLKGVGTEIRGIAAQLVAVMHGDFQGAKNIGDMMKADAAAARAEQDKLVQSILNRGQAEKKVFNDSKEQNSQYAAWRKDNEKALEKQYSKSERLAQKEKQLQADVTNGVINQTKATEALAGWKRIIMGEDKKPKVDRQGIKDLETEIDLRNKDLGLLGSFNNELDAIERRRAKTGDEDKYQKSLNALIEKQPIYLERQKEINAAHDLTNKLFGKADMLGNDYYKTLEQINKEEASGLRSPENAERARQAAFDQTELAKTRLKIEQDSAKLVEKYRDDIEKAQNASALETANLDDRLALLGLTSEQQKNLRIEQERRNKLLAIDLKLQTQIQEVWDKWGNGDFGVDGATKAKAVIKELTEQAGVDMQNVNKETAVKFREDFDAEMKQIKSGVTDSIVTALFEGGKAGSKKLRDVLVNVLRQKVTMVVDVGVNAFMNSMMGSFFGGGGGAGAGGAGGSSGLSSILGNLNGSVASAIGKGFTSFAGSSFGQSLGLSNSTAIAGNNPSAYAPAGTQLTSTGSAIGTGLGMIGSGIAGYGISSAISGGYTTGGNTVNVISGIASAFFGPIAGVIGGMVNRLFGRKLQDVGIQGTYSSDKGFSGQSYEYYKGGLFSSDKTKTNPLDAELTKTIDTTFKTMIAQVGTFANVLGLSSDKLKDFSTSFKISTKGLSQDEIQKQIAEALATSNNEMAQEVIGTWEETKPQVNTIFGRSKTVTDRTYKPSEYAKEGEKAIDTLTRLATSLSAVNQVFDTLGYTMYEASLKGGDMASKLADLFGGLDKLVAATTAYYQAFYSEEERQQTTLRQLTSEFKAHNLQIPKTREEYRKLVEAQDLATEEGRKMYAWLITLAPAFAQVTASTEDLVKQAKEAFAKLLEDAYAALEKAVKAQIDMLKEQETAQTAVVNNLNSIFDLLKKNVRELYQQVDSTNSMLVSQARGVISGAVSGGALPSLDVLSEAITTVRGSIEQGDYATQFEADKARLQFAADLKVLQDKTEVQLSTEEQILKAIKDSIKYYENLLIESRKQVDALLGISTAVLSVADALANLKNLMFPESAPNNSLQTSGGSSGGAGGITWGGQSNTSTKYTKPVGGYTGGTIYAGVSKAEEATLDKLAGGYHAFDGTGDVAGLNKWIVENKVTPDQLSGLSGLYATDWEKWYASNDIPKFADGGAFTNGVVQKPTMFNQSLMGESGPEAIMPLTSVGGKLGVSVAGSSDSTLSDRVSNLEFALQAIAVNTGKMARILDAAQGEDGRSIMTSNAPTT